MNNDPSRFTRRRAALRKLAWSGVLGTLGITGLLRAALAAGTGSGIRRIKGTVNVDGKPAVLGQRIEAGQTVTTDAGSEAVFVIGQDAFLQREHSTFRMETSDGVPVLRYLTGKVLSVFGKGRKTLITPTATIGIRGTACYIEAAPEQTYFCLCYGSAVITPTARPAQRMTLRTWHHEHPLYIHAGETQAMMAQAPVINHTDAELILLEGLTGRRPPFYGKHYRSE